MKINNIKLTVVILLMIMIAAISSGLFFISIPEGNGDVFYMLIGILLATLGRAMADLFKKE